MCCSIAMKKLLGFVLILTGSGCAKLMEDQPRTADSTQSATDTANLETATTKTPKVPERFEQFFYREFVGTVSPTGGRVHTLVVETIMDVAVEFGSGTPGIVFMIKKDGIDITEAPAASWEGRLVPGKYQIAVIPGTHSAKSVPYSLIVKEN